MGETAYSSVHCPACSCEISPDGKTLYHKSDYFEELLDSEKALPKIEERLRVSEASKTLPAAVPAPVKTRRKKNVVKETEKPAGTVGGGAKADGESKAGKLWFRR